MSVKSTTQAPDPDSMNESPFLTANTTRLTSRVVVMLSTLVVLSGFSLSNLAQQPELSWNDYFQPEQSEILVDQARSAVLEGFYPQAEILLDQAIQINRASQGLHNASQLALVDQLLETLLLQRKWDEFDQKLDYIRWLNQRIHADNPEQLVDGLLRQSDWHRAAAGAIQRSQSAWYLIQGKFLNWQAVSVLESRFGAIDPRVAPVLYQIVLEHYYQSVLNERRGTTSYDFKTDGKAIANGWMSSRNESVRRSYRIGRENLQKIRDLYRNVQDVPVTSDAMLQIHQADWEFLHGNNKEALELYQDAYFALLGTGVEESDLESFFARHRLLPVQQLQIQWTDPAAADNESSLEVTAWSALYPGAEMPAKFQQPPFRFAENARHSVQAELKLEISGEPGAGDFDYGVKGINIIGSDPDNEITHKRAFSELSLLKFRPRLAAGELVEHEPFIVNYRFAGE